MRGAIDEARRQAVFQVKGAHIRDAEWEFYALTFERLCTPKVGRPGCLLVIAEKGSDMPGARWRQRFASVAETLRLDATFVMVACSPVARAAVVAVTWLRPFSFRHAIVGTWEDGLSAACRLDGSPGLRGDLEALRQRVTPVAP